jgi:vacuolar-type H+-ATPase subunit D/Vma8
MTTVEMEKEMEFAVDSANRAWTAHAQCRIERIGLEQDLDSVRKKIDPESIAELWHDMWESANPELIGQYQWNFTNVQIAKMIDYMQEYFEKVTADSLLISPKDVPFECRS